MKNPIEPIYRVIGKNIAAVRNRRSITQEHLAALLKRSRSGISMMELGYSRFHAHTLVDVAFALGTTPARLLKGVE